MKILLFYSGQAFTGTDFRTTGVGGTEAAVVVLAEHLAKAGHHVQVAGGVPGLQTVAGVLYTPAAEAGQDTHDLAVLVKNWDPIADGVRAGRRAFFWTDVDTTDSAGLRRRIEWGDRVLVMSPFAERRLRAGLPDLIGDCVRVVGLPVDTASYPADDAARGNVLLYCSVPDRGLVHLAGMWPGIRRRVPTAELVITSDYTLWARASAQSEYESFFRGLAGVRYAGRVDRSDLVGWQLRAKVMAYPCHFEEGFCLAAAECMAAGCVPVTTDDFALSTTVGASGVLIPGRPWSWWYRRRFVRAVVRLLTDPAEWRRRSDLARVTARARFDPDMYATTFIEACCG